MAGYLGKSLEEVYALSECEIRQWEKFNETNPIGRFRQDFYLAQIAYMIVRSNGASGVKISDFLVDWGTDKEEILDGGEIQRRVLASGLFHFNQQTDAQEAS